MLRCLIYLLFPLHDGTSSYGPTMECQLPTAKFCPHEDVGPHKSYGNTLRMSSLIQLTIIPGSTRELTK